MWGYGEDEYKRHKREGRLWWGEENKNRVPAYKRFLIDVEDDGIVPQTIWLWGDAGHTQDGRKEQIALGHDTPFGTPKPEKLIEQVVQIGSKPGDLVLDSFLGSGTTAAVAHKMGRHYIGIEMGDHAVTHCVPRLRKVIEGEQGGISQSVGWQGGGGFRFYRLGEPVFDAEGRLNPAIRFATLAAHVWFAETGTALRTPATSPRLGIHDNTAIDLLYNGILGDRRPDGGNVLTSKVLEALPPHDGPRIIYGEASRIPAARLKALNITFRQTPYDLKIR